MAITCLKCQAMGTLGALLLSELHKPCLHTVAITCLKSLPETNPNRAKFRSTYNATCPAIDADVSLCLSGRARPGAS